MSETIVCIGSTIIFSTLKNSRNSLNVNSDKAKVSKNVDLTKNFQSSPKNIDHQIKQKFEPVIKISEQVTKDPVTFSYKSDSDNKNSSNDIDVTVSFALEPDSKNWSQKESTVLFKENDAFNIKRWVPKDNNESIEFPECRYSWSPISKSQKLKVPETDSTHLEQLKKFLQESTTNCNQSKTKGMEFTNSYKKYVG